MSADDRTHLAHRDRHGVTQPLLQPRHQTLRSISVRQVLHRDVGGLVTETLGRIPVAGERITFPDFEIEVLAMDGPRIDTVRVSPRALVDHGEF